MNEMKGNKMGRKKMNEVNGDKMGECINTRISNGFSNGFNPLLNFKKKCGQTKIKWRYYSPNFSSGFINPLLIIIKKKLNVQ